MKSAFAPVLLSLCIVSAHGETLYPVFGPRAAQAPPPVMTARFNGTASGKFTLIEANGESFQGKWSFVTASFVNAKTPQDPATYLPQPNLAFAWDAVYGQGYFLAKGVGQRMKQAVATGSLGTKLQIECLPGAFPGFYGIAVDSKGNIYKVVPSQ
ncbi:MAG: hypothetical protein ACLPY1_23650 [Terracidiphilus sp.]